MSIYGFSELKLRRFPFGSTLLACLLFLSPLHAEEKITKPPLILKKGDRIVMMGDSITEEKGYSKFLELYFAACLPELDLHTMHMGWSGAPIAGLLGRLKLLTIPYKPNIVTLSAGGANGGYSEYSPAIAEQYTKSLNAIVDQLKAINAISLVCSPCAMDAHFSKGPVHNESLEQLSILARQIAEAQHMPFADVNGDINKTAAKAKAVLGEDYPVCGPDGIHPYANGSLVITYALLKGMGVDGNIGTITLDMKGPATATEGHKVLSSQNGQAEIESTRYPFCFTGDEKSPLGTRSILPFLPFNQDLNRLMLVVKNLDSEKAKVTWGTASKIFTKKELTSGINLADAFVEANPFQKNFEKADAAVLAKQNLETDCKHVVEDFNDLTDEDAETKAQLDGIRRKIEDILEKSRTEVRAILSPVKYTLTVTPEA